MPLWQPRLEPISYLKRNSLRARLRRSSAGNPRLLILAVVVLAGLGTLVAKLFYEQGVRHPYWRERLSAYGEVKVRIPSTRGGITDRNGVVLAENRAANTVEFYLPDIVRAYRATRATLPMVQYAGTVAQMQKVKREADIVKIVEEAVIPRLKQLGLAGEYNEERLRKHFRHHSEVPFIYAEDIPFAEAARFAEGNTGIPGVNVTTRPARRYPLGAFAAHLLGYVGPVKHLEREEDIGDYTFYEPDLEGKADIERAFDRYLRGRPGARILQRSPKGLITGELRRHEPTPGANVVLTLDARVQASVEAALRDSGIGRGAAVVLDPNNGEILGMASVPSYDPNVFIPSIATEDWSQLNADETNPMLNRAVQSYAPGSIFKTVTALAGLRAGIAPTKTFTCSGGVQYGSKYMKCWIAGRGTHGALTLPDAIKHSCNAFFYLWGNTAGIEQIEAVGTALGLGHKTELPVSGESAGVLPSPGWLRSVSPTERWSDGYTANTAIGQGYVLTSPLQMATVAAALANGGTVYQPRLVRDVVDAQGQTVTDSSTGQPVIARAPAVRADLRQLGLSAASIETVRDGMRRVVESGTGKRAQIPGTVVAGKTGTAQFWRGNVPDNHTWFIAFAPYEAPRFAVCVLVQGAKSGGGVSAPIAQRILAECLRVEPAPAGNLTALPPARGHLRPIESVLYASASNVPPAEQATAATVKAAEIPVGVAVPFEALADPETADEDPPAARFRATPLPRAPKPEIRDRPSGSGSSSLLKPFRM